MTFSGQPAVDAAGFYFAGFLSLVLFASPFYIYLAMSHLLMIREVSSDPGQ
jgi:hypothetical protein